MMTYGGSVLRPRPRARVRAVPAPGGAARRSSPGRCPAVSSRCSRWRGRSATEPALLLLDEISMGLAPLIVQELYEHVKRIAEEGVAILLTEQYAATALGVADYAAIMTQGQGPGRSGSRRTSRTSSPAFTWGLAK